MKIHPPLQKPYYPSKSPITIGAPNRMPVTQAPNSPGQHASRMGDCTGQLDPQDAGQPTYWVIKYDMMFYDEYWTGQGSERRERRV